MSPWLGDPCRSAASGEAAMRSEGLGLALPRPVTAQTLQSHRPPTWLLFSTLLPWFVVPFSNPPPPTSLSGDEMVFQWPNGSRTRLCCPVQFPPHLPGAVGLLRSHEVSPIGPQHALAATPRDCAALGTSWFTALAPPVLPKERAPGRRRHSDHMALSGFAAGHHNRPALGLLPNHARRCTSHAAWLARMAD